MKHVSPVKRSHKVLLVLVLTVTFAGAIFLHGKSLYISPDETANAFFARTYAQSGTLKWFDPINIRFHDRIHPRSVESINGWLVPGSFIGLPVLYGSLIALVGSWVLHLATPIVFLLCILAWYAITRRLFEDRIALISSILLAFHPGWWYYTARGLMHNVLFTSLVVFCAYFLLVRPVQSLLKQKNKTPWFEDLDVVLGGIMLGLALMVRLSEVIWIGIGLIIIAFWLRKKIQWKTTVLFLLSILLALSPMFFLNRATYGDPFLTGYTLPDREIDQDVEGDSVEAVTTEAIETGSSFVLPFGVNLRAAGKHVLQYGLGLFWWMGVLALLGIPLLFPRQDVPKRERQPRRLFFAISVVISAWLAIMYGSWRIFDNPDITQVTIANSYVRYWLPIYLVMTPFAAYAIFWIADRGRTELAKKFIVATVILASLGLSMRVVFFHAEDGLVAIASTLDRSAEIKSEVLELTEPDSVIIVDRADKIFFPDRRVLYPLRSEDTYNLMPQIERRVPLYYYGITFPPKDIDYLNSRKLKERGLQIELLATYDEESLYRIFSP